MDLEKLIDTVTTYGTEYGLKVLAAIVIWIIGYRIRIKSIGSHCYMDYWILDY